MTAAFWGYVLGSVTIVAVILAVSWVVDSSAIVVIIAAAVALSLVVLIGWMDWWIVVFIGLILAVLLVFGNGVPSFSFGRGSGGA